MIKLYNDLNERLTVSWSASEQAISPPSYAASLMDYKEEFGEMQSPLSILNTGEKEYKRGGGKKKEVHG